MADSDPALLAFIRHGREERNLEYKGSSGRDPFAWGTDTVNAKVARTVMAMANIGGGTLVVGMDENPPGQWRPNGVAADVAASYKQDDVQLYVNQRADPYVRLAVRDAEMNGRQFIVIQVEGFDELPVVCTRG